MPTYDVHAHCAPNGLFSHLADEGHRYGTELIHTDKGPAVRFAGGVTTPPVEALSPYRFDDMTARLQVMDSGRIDVQFLSSWIDLTAYSLPRQLGIRYARMFNEYLAATAATQPGRFECLCTVPLQDGQAAAAELIHAVTTLGMVGVEIATTVSGRELDAPEHEPFWATAAELRCPVLIHPYRALRGRDLSRYFMDNLVGNPAESTIAAAHLVFGGVLDRHPDLRIVLVHGGGYFPWQAGRWSHGFESIPIARSGGLRTDPVRLLDRFHFDTLLHDSTRVAALIEWVGAERVVLGSDYPFPMGDHAPVDTADAVRGLSEVARTLVLGGNVERLINDVRR